MKELTLLQEEIFVYIKSGEPRNDQQWCKQHGISRKEFNDNCEILADIGLLNRTNIGHAKSGGKVSITFCDYE